MHSGSVLRSTRGSGQALAAPKAARTLGQRHLALVSSTSNGRHPAPSTLHIVPRHPGANLGEGPQSDTSTSYNPGTNGRAPPPTAAATASAHRVFMFDPANPGNVREVLVEPHADLEAAEEILQGVEEERAAAAHEQQQAEEQARNGLASSGGAASTTAPSVRHIPTRSPMPFRTASPMPARGAAASGSGSRVTPLGGMSRAVMGAPQPSRADGTATPSPARGLVASSQSQAAIQAAQAREAKATEMAQQLVVQLEREQARVAQLAQYEGMYREWRMRAERLESDVSVMQRAVADKDAELAHGYKLLEAAAERTRALQQALAEARAQRAALQSSSSASASQNGSGQQAGEGAGSSGESVKAMAGEVQGAILDLAAMAQALARDMSQEVVAMAPLPDTPPVPSVNDAAPGAGALSAASVMDGESVAAQAQSHQQHQHA
uniref:Uncharacterized protein n=1 Tax=Chlamydomonas leiostraca TaxID=1034604 RepID=A0A7S0R2N6_9CHLO|mmetsp:Transcript_12360/g.30308  ORF Transcript_12360/g.30308 Transcript_12360/m.30308 type:complete len:437 (+) Transcript_12360:183-1493(+)|eukprot:CAMPEP_0202858626 /NCGR_PEP_ID=MMETSP1391-20130828/1072_1 /ASSEMBLY_ACC=CAM_ASM_000867 /TAXON_ID=1034604 /ORGANISM="Chlamydomonas leiostraca, Strain SAG 11-49" /LENGTH=436 /DNA_ID=CAMNT_0049537559 /DNA_START=182 /DNA_END=1492 /DNA_ORIENTATION=-